MDKKISVVLMGRNDNYGDNLHHRAIHSLVNFITNYDEVIYVDWKSPNEISLIQDIKHYLPQTQKLKIFEVTKNDIIHNNPEYIDYSIVEVLGRNIGIRRASNDWILVSNIDIITPRIEIESYSKNILYTSARKNIPEETHLKFNMTQILNDYLEENHNNFETMPDSVVNGVAVWDPGDVWSLVVGCGDCQFAHKDVWYGIKGFEEEAGGRCYADSNIMKKAALNYKIEKCFHPLYHLNHNNNKIKIEGEILPINDRYHFVNNFTKTTNSENWGWANYKLKNYII